jgi:TFIIF-interacting CTD phosphatase-like protein
MHPSGKYQVKDLLILLENRDIKDIIIVDNKALSFAIHFTNGIPIKDYEGDKSDTELKSITPYLMALYRTQDVRSKIKLDFKLEKLVLLRT